MPRLSVAMPCYNGAETVKLAIASILSQSFTDFELLIPDDGSTDNSAAIVKEFNDERIFAWSDGVNRKLPIRLNECIDRARGELFARMDADDIAFPDRLKRQVEFLAAHPDIDLCGTSMVVFAKNKLQYGVHPPLDHGTISKSPYKAIALMHPTWMGRTEWFRRWRYFEPAPGVASFHLAEDQELLLRSFTESTFANLPDVLLGYRIENESLKKLWRYKIYWGRFIAEQQAHASVPYRLYLYGIQGAKFAANCVTRMMGPSFYATRQYGRKISDSERSAWNAVLGTLGETSS